jgi:RHS repeat-associated protein
MAYQTAPGQISPVTETFTHDELGRLTHWASGQGDMSGTWSVHYDYDDIGNIKDRDYVSPEGSERKYYYTPGATDAGWGGPHAITEVDLYESTGVGGNMTPYIQKYRYDGAGRQVSAITPTDSRTQTFTDFDLPRQIAGNPLTWNFSYDANHQRVAKVASQNGSPVSRTVYLGKLYEKRTDSSGVASHVMYVLGEGGAVIAQRTQPDGGGTATMDYLHNDRLGSVTHISSSDGSTTKMRFDPFGARLSSDAPPSQASNPLQRMSLGFIGQENEDDLGLVNLNGRIYDPNLMRFLSADPIISRPMNSQGYNRYSYANNSPFHFKDPSGLDIVDVITAILGGGEPGGGVSDPGSGNGYDGGGGYGSSGGPGYGNGGGNPGGGSSAGGGWSGWQSVGGTSAAAPAGPPPTPFNGSNYNVGTNAFSQSFGAGGNVWGAPTIADGTVDGTSGWAGGMGWSQRAEDEFGGAQSEYSAWLAVGRADAILLPKSMPDVANVADMLRQAFGHAGPGGLLWFGGQVKPGGPWDFKNLGGRNAHPEWEDAGNFLYGLTGRALGVQEMFPFFQDALRTAAGAAHWWSPASTQWEFGSWYSEPFHGDGPDDQFWMEQGERALLIIQGIKY